MKIKHREKADPLWFCLLKLVQFILDDAATFAGGAGHIGG